MSKPITYFWAKPIPIRHFDWEAVEDGYDQGDPIGYGATEAEAIADLEQQIEDHDERETLTDQTRNDPHKFDDWQRQQNEGEPLRSLPPRKPIYCADDGYNAAQGSHFNPNGWCRD